MMKIYFMEKMMRSEQFQVFDFGRYGQALALIKAGRLVNVVQIQASEKTGGIRTAKIPADLKDRVLEALRRR